HDERPLNLYCNRARLLNKNTKDTRDHSRVLCYFKWFCPLSWKTESRANFDFAAYGFRYQKQNGQNKKDKGLRWRFFSAAFCKTRPVPCLFYTSHESTSPFCCGATGKVFLFLFSRKIHKGRTGLVLTGTQYA